MKNRYQRDPIPRPIRLKHCIFSILIACFAIPLSTQAVLALEFQTGSEERDYRGGMELMKSGEHDLAELQFQTFLETYPTSKARGRAMIGLAEIYYLENQFDSAALFYSRGLQEGNLTEKLKQTAVKRGFKASLQSDRNERVKRFFKLLENKGSFSPSQDYLRTTYEVLEENGDTEMSYRLAKKQLDTHPDSGYWKYRVAVNHARRNEFNQALSLLDGLGEPWTQLRYDATLTKADVQFEQGKLDAAESRYQFLLKQDVHEMEGRYGLAWIEIKRGNLQLARDLLSLVTHADTPLRMEAARDLARIHRQEGNKQLAIQWYKQASDWADDSTRQQIEAELNTIQDKEKNSS